MFASADILRSVSTHYQVLRSVGSKNITYLNCLDRVAQLEEHWTSKPQVAGLVPTAVELIFQLA